METPNYFDIIEDAKKYFFAEDIISYFMLSSRFKPYFRTPITKRCYRLIPRAFNDVIETAVCFLYSRISVFNTFRSFEVNEMTNKGAFLLFACNLETRYFSNGYNPQKFLYYCTHLAYMAISFYKAGNTAIPKLAVCCIVRTMKMYQVPEVKFWNGLSIAALRYTKIALKCGFAKMSDFESMKIQFVVNQPFEEQTADDNDRIVEGSAINTEQKDDLCKLSSDLQRKIAVIGGQFTFNLSAFYEENFNRESSSDHSSTNPKESLETAVEEKSILENTLDTECANPPTITSELKRNISLPQKYRVFQVLSGLVNRPEVFAFHESCKRSFNTNRDFSPKDMQSSAVVTEDLRSPKKECNVTLIKSDAAEKTEKDSKYFDESKEEEQSSTTVNHGQKLSPRISGDKYAGYLSENKSHKKSPNSAANEETFSTTGMESARHCTPEVFTSTVEYETEDCPLKTVNFDICDPFVMYVAKTGGNDIELCETHESFMRNEDYFNSTFDILSAAHYMATHGGDRCLNIGTLI